ncbi:MAG: ComF family protein [Rhodospirillales bacterium]|nr:ComF family protein [Rhodospirillales bacterium]
MSLKPFQNILMQAVDTVLPPRCVVTGERVDEQGMLAPEAWGALEFISDPLCDQCGFPFDFEVEEGSLCASCLDHPPPFECARAALKYNETSRDLVLGFKHGDQTHVARAFVPWLEKAGAPFWEEADLLIPVPLHRWRLLRRRYNQAALIAQALSKRTGIPADVGVLQRVRATPVQGHLHAGERHKNVKKAFGLHPDKKDALKGKTLILIDDVYTTGATVKECTKTLLKGGAAKVHILTLTRVVREGFGG